MRILADENVKGAIVRGLLRVRPLLDIITVEDAGIREMPDPALLEWAATEERVLISHDARTMPEFFKLHLEAGKRSPGVFIIPSRLSVGRAIDDLVLLIECSTEGEWENILLRLPL